MKRSLVNKPLARLSANRSVDADNVCILCEFGFAVAEGERGTYSNFGRQEAMKSIRVARREMIMFKHSWDNLFIRNVVVFTVDRKILRLPKEKTRLLAVPGVRR